jgi:hypothetical protein
MYKIIGANNAEYGPVTTEQLRQWIAEGRADGNTKAQMIGETGWRPLSEIPEFASSFQQASAPPGISQAAPPYPGRPMASSAPTPGPMGGPPLSNAPYPQQQVPNYLVWAILVTLCCCLPLGIVSIVYASQVNGKLQAGDYQGALAASKNAKMWCWIAFGLGLVLNVIVFGIQFAAGMAQGLQQH